MLGLRIIRDRFVAGTHQRGLTRHPPAHTSDLAVASQGCGSFDAI